MQECAELLFLWADRDKIGKNSWKTSVYFHLSVYIMYCWPFCGNYKILLNNIPFELFYWHVLSFTVACILLFTHSFFFLILWSVVVCIWWCLYSELKFIHFSNNTRFCLLFWTFLYEQKRLCMVRDIWDIFAVLVQLFNPTAYLEKQTVPSDTQQNTFFKIWYDMIRYFQS
jgi:hypothetical protein